MDRGSKVRDRTLYPYSHTPLDSTVYQVLFVNHHQNHWGTPFDQEKSLGAHLMDGVRKRLSETGFRQQRAFLNWIEKATEIGL